MTQETLEQQPSTPVTTPSSTDNSGAATLAQLQKDLAAAQRSYNGLDGNFKKVKQERDAFEAQLNEQASKYEGEKMSIKTERDTLDSNLKKTSEELEQLRGQTTTQSEELETLRLIVADFPDLAPFFAKGLIRPVGLKGDDLKNFLTQWSTTFNEMGQTLTSQKNTGTVTPPPNSQNTANLTLEEASDRKMNALRTQGPQSEDYKSYSKLEEELIRSRKK